jgi:predicted DNA-binding transcriptional regulator YafY
MKLSTNQRRRLSVQISPGRAGRLHRLILLLAAGSHRREDLLVELGIGLRTFYREIELVKRCGIKVQNKDRKFSLLTTAEQAERRLPFTDPHLSFAEMADLSRHPGPASRRLAELLARVTHHPDLAVASSRSADQGKATHSSPGN